MHCTWWGVLAAAVGGWAERCGWAEGGVWRRRVRRVKTEVSEGSAQHRRTTQGSVPDVTKAIKDQFEPERPCGGWQWCGRYRLPCFACAPVAVAADWCVCVSPVAPSLL